MRGLLVVATLVAIASVFAMWANRQVLDADNWAKTSSELLENQAIRRQLAWEEANRVTAQRFIDIAEGDSRAITLSGNAVVLNVRQVLVDLVRRLGGSGRLIGKIPPDAGRIKVMNSDQVSGLQNAVTAVRGLSAVLPGLAVLRRQVAEEFPDVTTVDVGASLRGAPPAHCTPYRRRGRPYADRAARAAGCAAPQRRLERRGFAAEKVAVTREEPPR